MMIGTFVEVHVRTELVRTPMIHITSYTTLIQLAFYNYLRVLASFYFSVPCLFSDPLASTSRAVLVFFCPRHKAFHWREVHHAFFQDLGQGQWLREENLLVDEEF